MQQRVAIIGAGIAGATVAHALTHAGHTVQTFDKSRGPGGRLATRRIDWVDAQGRACTTRLDHGAVGITARSAAFQRFVGQALQAGWLVEWQPVLAANSWPPEGEDRQYLPVPGMPALCRHLLDGLQASWSFGVDKLHRGPHGWQLESGGERHAAAFDAVVLALPPAQAAPLLAPHRGDWARHAALAPMQSCWTLMGVEQIDDLADDLADDAAAHWDLARPPAGPLACVLRSDSRPGRERVPGRAHWVAHARAGWSCRQLEQPAGWVQAQLQAALVNQLGRPVDWGHCTVHRWRQAMPRAQRGLPAQSCWWDPAAGLGVCGDFLGGCGVEGAWLSAQSLSTALLQCSAETLGLAAETSSHGLSRRIAA